MRQRKMRSLRALLTSVLLPTAVLFCAAPAPVARAADDTTWNPASLKFAPLREIKLPDVQRTVLPNGMVLYLLEDHEFPTVEGRILLRVGSQLDPNDKVGLAVMTGDVLRSGGSLRYPGDELDKTLEGMGASLEFNIGDSDANGTFWCLRENAPQVLAIVADLMQHPSFPQEKIDLSKVGMRRDIAGRNDQPEDILMREMRKMIYGKDHPFSRIPQYATVEAVTRDDMVAFHGQYFRPDRVYMTIWGDFDAKQIHSQIESLYADWKPSGAPLPKESPNPALVPGGQVFYGEKKGMTNAWVVAGHVGIKADNPDYATMNVMAELLGGGFGSRLINEIRTKRGLAYATGASSGADLPRPGIFLAYASTRSDSALVVLDLVKKEIARLTTQPVTPEELDAAKNTILNSYVFRFATKGRIAARMAYLDFYGYPADFTARYPEQVKQVTVQQFLDVSRRNLHPNDLQVLLVGDQKDFATPVASLGNVQTIDLTIPEPPSKGAPAPAATLESMAAGKQILAHAAEVTGGSAAWASIKDYTEENMTTVTIRNMPIDIQGKMIQTADGREYMYQKLPFGVMTMVYNGQAGWKKTPRGLEDLSPDDIAQLVEERARGFWSLFSRPDTYQTQAVAGEEIEGKKCDAVLLSGGGIKQATLFVDAATGVPVAIRYQGSGPDGAPAEIMETYGDWRPVGSVKMPFGTKTIVDGKPFGVGVVKTAVVNGGVDETLFGMPK